MFFDSLQSLVSCKQSTLGEPCWLALTAHRHRLLLSHILADGREAVRKVRASSVWSPPTFPLNFQNQVTESRGEEVYHHKALKNAGLTLRQWSSSTPISLLNVGTISLPSVQYIPRLLSDTTHDLLCPGSCCLCLAREVTLTGVLNGDSFCSHSEIQEATEMLLQELERLWSCGWLMGCWPLES